MRKTKIQLIEREVTTPNSLVRISEDLDRNYDRLTGIAFLHTIGNGHILQSLTVDSTEVFPRGFEVAFLQSNLQVAPKDRFFPISEIAQGKKIEIDFQDCEAESNDSDTSDNDYDSTLGSLGSEADPNNNNAKYPYTLKIYLELTND